MEQPARRVLHSATHLARTGAPEHPYDTFEAEIFIRLVKALATAGTYILAGTFSATKQARDAATAGANRAIENQEL